MIIKFSKTPFFLWSTFGRETCLEKEGNYFLAQTQIKKLKLVPSSKKFFFIKYFMVFILIFFSISLNELLSLDLSLLLSPLLALIVYLYIKYYKEILVASIIPVLALFYYIDILYLPYFIKYFVISFVLIELYFDIFKKKHFAVYELSLINDEGEEVSQDSKSIMSFASINKNQLKEKN